jgi:UDP-N-acetylglucosamine transferase subunit ALG13
MIFVTIGTQVPFDRMIQAVDEVAPLLQGKEIIVQALESQYKAKHFKTLDYISPADFKHYIGSSELVISHAGTGTILSVAQLEIPLIVFPRSGKLKETRNDHQMATCRKLEKITRLQVAYDQQQLMEKVRLYTQGKLPVMQKVPAHASGGMLDSIRSFIEADKKLLVVPTVYSNP